MDQSAGGGIQQPQYGESHRYQVDEHGKANAEPNGVDRGIGQPLQLSLIHI